MIFTKSYLINTGKFWAGNSIFCFNCKSVYSEVFIPNLPTENYFFNLLNGSFVGELLCYVVIGTVFILNCRWPEVFDGVVTIGRFLVGLGNYIFFLKLSRSFFCISSIFGSILILCFLFFLGLLNWIDVFWVDFLL